MRRAIADIVRSHDGAEWEARFAGLDVCVNVVRTLDEAVNNPHFTARGLFAHRITDGAGRSMPALPVPVADLFRGDASRPLSYPVLGEAQNDPHYKVN